MVEGQSGAFDCSINELPRQVVSIVVEEFACIFNRRSRQHFHATLRRFGLCTIEHTQADLLPRPVRPSAAPTTASAGALPPRSRRVPLRPALLRTLRVLPPETAAAVYGREQVHAAASLCRQDVCVRGVPEVWGEEKGRREGLVEDQRRERERVRAGERAPGGERGVHGVLRADCAVLRGPGRRR